MSDLALLDAKTAVNALVGLTSEFSGDVEAIEGAMLQHEQVSCPVIHRFGPGIYIREVRLQAGTFVVGHRQNFEQMNIMLQGRLTMVNDNGSVSELVAPTMYVGKPGRKVVYVHEDVVWLNVYSTDETDVEKLEAKYITKSDTWSKECDDKLLALQYSVDKKDYTDALADIGVSEEFARACSENTEDMVDLPHGGYKVKIGSSKIEGKGLFATADIDAGEIIAPARINWKRTIAGRYTNHSANPNAIMERVGNDIDLVAIRPIAGCRGGFDGEEITVDYRQAAALTLSIGKET